jgi:dienelactone hydrolase
MPENINEPAPFVLYSNNALSEDIFPYPVFYLPEAQGPGIVVLHELPGLNKHVLDLASKISEAGFQVFVPCLFGKPGQGSILKGGISSLALCIREVMTRFAGGQPSSLSLQLQTLGQHVAKITQGSIGVVGLCVTGNFALTVVADRDARVKAVVSGEPSTGVMLEEAAIRTNLEESGGKILAFRYEQDFVCRPSRLQYINNTFPGRAECHTMQGSGHSVLTNDLSPAALEKTIAFLKEQLATTQANSA